MAPKICSRCALDKLRSHDSVPGLQLRRVIVVGHVMNVLSMSQE